MTAENRRLVGGADIAALLGLSPWATPFTVWHRIVHGEGMDESEVMRHGRALEPALLEMHLEERPRDREQLIRSPEILHPRTRHGIGHLDALSPSCVIELKSVHWAARDKWAQGVPEHVRLQVDWYMQCASVERAEVGAFFGLGDFRVWDVSPLPDDVRAGILATVEKFWRDFVEPAKPPPLDASAAAEKWVDRFPRAEKTECALDATAAALARELLQKKAQLEALANEKRALELRLKESIGPHWVATAPGVRVTHSWASRKSFDLESAIAAGDVSREVVARHQKTTDYRIFKLTEKPE